MKNSFIKDRLSINFWACMVNANFSEQNSLWGAWGMKETFKGDGCVNKSRMKHSLSHPLYSALGHGGIDATHSQKTQLRLLFLCFSSWNTQNIHDQTNVWTDFSCLNYVSGPTVTMKSKWTIFLNFFLQNVAMFIINILSVYIIV